MKKVLKQRLKDLALYVAICTVTTGIVIAMFASGMSWDFFAKRVGLGIEPKKYFGMLVSANNLPNLLLVAVGIVGIILAWRTVNATRDAAKAALLNAQAVINAERALLLFKVEKRSREGQLGEADFQIFARNYGRTPARHIEIGEPIHAFTKLDDFAAWPPDYGEDIEDIQEYLAPGEMWLVATFSPTRREIAAFAETSKIPLNEIENIIYGQITYYDGISPDLRHSRYCLAHDKSVFSIVGGTVVPVGSRAYLECT